MQMTNRLSYFCLFIESRLDVPLLRISKDVHLNVWLIGAPLTLNCKHLNRLASLSRCHIFVLMASRVPIFELIRDKGRIGGLLNLKKKKNHFWVSHSTSWLIVSSWPYGYKTKKAGVSLPTICNRPRAAGTGDRFFAIISALFSVGVCGCCGHTWAKSHPTRSCVWIALQFELRWNNASPPCFFFLFLCVCVCVWPNGGFSFRQQLEGMEMSSKNRFRQIKNALMDRGLEHEKKERQKRRKK